MNTNEPAQQASVQDILDWIIEADIAAMQHEMKRGNLSSEVLVTVYLERIRQLDGLLHAVLELNPDALAVARMLDRERESGGLRGPLHGIPVLVKDNIATADKLHTSAGALALAEAYASEDAVVITRLRAAGAVILGKTNMTEWANFMSGSMWAGYSSRGGLVLNPYGPGELFVGGSSSGSAAAVAANLTAAALGTETSGSIISPAAQNSLVGIKPTWGLVSRTGIIPGIGSQDTAGPLSRTVKDAALLLGVIAGSGEPLPAAAGSAAAADYCVHLHSGFVRSKRIGIPRFYYSELDDEALLVMEAAIADLKELGAEIIDHIELPGQHAEWNPAVLQYEFKRGLNAYLAGLPESAPVHSLQELIDFNRQHSGTALKYGQDTLEWLNVSGDGITEEAYLEQLALSRSLAGAQGIDYALEHYGLHAILLPGCMGADLAARAGYPLVTVPAGYTANGIIAPGGYVTKGPQGITFCASAFSEPLLLGIAYDFEQATRHRVAPVLEPGGFASAT
ncbi:amidase family protein [Paenibacillus sp. MMS20-IR301]|uniref:amidase family protein n=1 Tax=Paenibacillus sp. MMS20-IR301 TaxID=2895946 RepID=UPI0028F15FE1|nr:amidase family protein [Paenibacillus sp. MMS20-IR301]WNS45628.1 amidase family protein [Paenibacillus sp. MMS20-IR301]